MLKTGKCDDCEASCQGIMRVGAMLEIRGADTAGTHAAIIGAVHIGRHCVIGANSVVTEDVPDYCVVAGAPAKVIKTYDFRENKWVAAKHEDPDAYKLEG